MFKRRLHVCVGLLMLWLLLSFAGGCVRHNTERHGVEYVKLPEPSGVYLMDGGQLVMSFYVEREHQPDEAGWHWLVVEPDATAKLFATASLDGHAPTHPSAYFAIHFDPRDSRQNASLIPPLLEPGLASADEPPLAYDSLKTVQLTHNPRYGGLHLQPVGSNGQIASERVLIWLRQAIYQTQAGKRREAADRLLALPAHASIAALTTPVMVVPGGVQSWWYFVDWMFCTPDYGRD